MISGSSSVEALLPGSPTAIQTVIETVSSGIAPAQAIGNAWQMMTIPSWSGNAATSWAAFAPREAGHHSATPTAMRRASSAMLRYQAAFQIARAEIAAAIADAARAEQATASARAEHQSAVRKANQAQPGTPEAKVPSYTDPGASGLAAAETRYATAVAAFQRTGDEVAAEITAASYTTSGVRPAIMAPPGYKPDIDLARGWDFIRGFFLQLGGTVVGLLELTWMMTPPGMVQYFIENYGYLFEGPEGWARHDAEMRELWASGAIWQSFANTFLAADKWEDHPYEAAGRVTFEGLSLLIGVLKAPKIVSAARAARAASRIRPTPQVSNPKLQNIINDLFRGTKSENRVGDGTTMDAIRNEIATGEPTGSKFHFEKGRIYLRGLKKWLRSNPNAPADERKIAEELVIELEEVLP